MKKGLIAFLSVFMLAVLAACGTSPESIELSESEVTINQNETMTIEATVSPEELEDQVTWESSDEDVVMVNSQGEIGGAAGGTATITATVGEEDDEMSASVEVTVLPLVDYVNVDNANPTLYMGEDRPINWDITLVESSQTDTWEVGDLEFNSTDEDVITVSDDGVMTPQSTGSAEIEVKAGSKFVYIEASVEEPEPVVQDALMPSESTDEDLELPTSWTLSSENEFSVTWTSGNTDYIADDGTITHPDYEDGPQDVTMTADATSDDFDYSFEYVVTVADQENDSISVAREEDDDTEVTVTGVVHSYRESEEGFFIQDDNGDSLFVYEDFSEDEDDPSDFEDIEVGDEYVITGTITTYTNFGNELRQLTDVTLDKEVTNENDYMVEEDMSAAEIAMADHIDTGGVRYRLEDLEIAEITSFGEMIFETTGSAMKLKFELDEYGQHLDGYYEEGDTIDWMEFTVYDVHFDNLRLDGVVLPEPSEENVQWYADQELDITDETDEDIDLPDELVIAADYDNPTTYDVTWESFNTDYIDHDGTVTQPEFGNGDATVTLVRTVAHEGFEYKTAHEVTVPQITEVLYEDLEGTDATAPEGWEYDVDDEYADGSQKLSSTDHYITTEDFALTAPATFEVNIIANGTMDSTLTFTDQDGNVLHTEDITSSGEDTITFDIEDTDVTSVTMTYDKTSGNVGIYDVAIDYID